MRAGADLVEKDPSQIVTFGIRPTYPAESFGYIQRMRPFQRMRDSSVRSRTIREKPDRKTAEEYLASGVFIGIAVYPLEGQDHFGCAAEFEPEMAQWIDYIAKSIGTSNCQQPSAMVSKRSRVNRSTSLMERFRNVAVIEAPFTWDDVGSWQAMARLIEPDAQGNAVQGRT